MFISETRTSTISCPVEASASMSAHLAATYPTIGVTRDQVSPGTSSTWLATRLPAPMLWLIALSVALTLQFIPAARPALAYNCVNVVLRDPYWGQYRRLIESGGNAASLAPVFARNGFAVDGTPRVGDMIVWPSGYAGASGVGHVGIVSAVPGNGTVTVRHENWPYGSAEHPQVFPIRPGFSFVHRAVVVHTVAPDAPDAPEAEEEADEEAVYPKPG